MTRKATGVMSTGDGVNVSDAFSLHESPGARRTTSIVQSQFSRANSLRDSRLSKSRGTISKHELTHYNNLLSNLKEQRVGKDNV